MTFFVFLIGITTVTSCPFSAAYLRIDLIVGISEVEIWSAIPWGFITFAGFFESTNSEFIEKQLSLAPIIDLKICKLFGFVTSSDLNILLWERWELNIFWNLDIILKGNLFGSWWLNKPTQMKPDCLYK